MTHSPITALTFCSRKSFLKTKEENVNRYVIICVLLFELCDGCTEKFANEFKKLLAVLACINFEIKYILNCYLKYCVSYFPNIFLMVARVIKT